MQSKVGVLILVFLIISAGIWWYRTASHPPAKAAFLVVTTVAPLTNIVQTVAGSDARVQGIIPEGTDSHTFEPAPSDAQLLAAADLIILNGLHLESPTEKLALASKKKDTEIYSLGDHTVSEGEWIFDFSFPKDHGDPNPHLWMNPMYAKKYAQMTAQELGKHDPVHATAYEDRYQQYAARLDSLDEAIRQSLATIPEQNRKLLTYHDSWAYFSRRYGMQVIGAIQPSDFSEPSPGEVAQFIDQVKTSRLPAIFGSEVFPNKVLDQIGKEAHVQWVTTLRDDDLPGEPTSPKHTYIGMMQDDVHTMVQALGGVTDAIDRVDPTPLL